MKGQENSFINFEYYDLANGKENIGAHMNI